MTELLVATAITLTVTAAIFGLLHPAQGIFQAQLEVADIHQRLRAGVDALTRDLLMAGAGLPPSVAPLVPYRVGEQGSDSGPGILYHPNVISIRYVPWSEMTPVSHTYYLRTDPVTNASQLMHYDGAETDLPMIDHVVKLEFGYVGPNQMFFDPTTLQDGPWIPDDLDPERFDADLLEIRRVRVLLRMQAAFASMRGPSGVLFTRGGTSTSAERYVPDRELQFDVVPRNMSLGR